MRVRPVVEDVAEQIDVGREDGLRPEEIVRHELDPGGHGGGDGVAGAADHVGEVLDDEVQVLVGLGEGDADVAAGAADVHDHGGGVLASGFVFVFVVADGGPGVAVCQEAGREAEAVGEGRHGPREALGHIRVRGVEIPDGLVGVLGQAPSGSVGLVALELFARFDRLRERLPHLVEHVPQPRFGVGVFRELARGGGMGHVSFAGFLEHAVVGNGEADDASDVRFRYAAFASEVREGDFPVDGDVGCDVVFIDRL